MLPTLWASWMVLLIWAGLRCLCICHQLCAGSGFPDFACVLSAHWGLVPIFCSLILHQAGLGLFKGWYQTSNSESACAQGFWRNWHDITSIALYCPKQVRNPAHIQGKRKETASVDGWAAESYFKGWWRRIGAISTNKLWKFRMFRCLGCCWRHILLECKVLVTKGYSGLSPTIFLSVIS